MENRDEELLKQAREGDSAALAAIYDQYYGPLYGYIYRQVGHVDTARDLTAHVFERLLETLPTGKGPQQQLRPWLYRVAHNGVVDFYRRQQHRQHLPLEDQVLASADRPDIEAEQQLLAADVRAALVTLTPEQQQVIALKFLAGLSNAEVADIVDKPVGAVKSLQHRALAALQRRLLPAPEKVP